MYTHTLFIWPCAEHVLNNPSRAVATATGRRGYNRYKHI